MDIFPEFPPDRLKDPKRRAEKDIYHQLHESEVPGYALYEAKPSFRAPQLDFPVWLERSGRIAMQCKGGTYKIERGKWYLRTPEGWKREECPVMATWGAAMAMKDAIEHQLGRGAFVAAVLAFPDMKHSPVIHRRAREHNVHAVFGSENLVERLVDLLNGQDIKYPPTAWQIQQEVEVIMPVLAQPPQAEQPPRIVIEHAENVNVYVTPEDIQAGLLGLPPQQ